MTHSHPKIVVVGSSNTDMVIQTARLPAPGETVLGRGFAMVAGGKGANQAVAAARLGGSVTFIARVGADSFGDAAIENFRNDGIDTTFVTRDPDAPSGVAMIGVDTASGENAIIVAPGANGNLSVEDVEAARSAIAGADILVCQLEVPLRTIEAALKIAYESGVRALLNPAPAQVLSPEILKLVDILTPNETEAALLTGGDSAGHAQSAAVLLRQGVGAVIVTLGPNGAYFAGPYARAVYPTRPAQHVADTTGAGDCFTGALAVALGSGRGFDDAIAFANAAASICVTRPGAQPAMPRRAEVDALLDC